jgi:hypothetical protein
LHNSLCQTRSIFIGEGQRHVACPRPLVKLHRKSSGRSRNRWCHIIQRLLTIGLCATLSNCQV